MEVFRPELPASDPARVENSTTPLDTYLPPPFHLRALEICIARCNFSGNQRGRLETRTEEGGPCSRARQSCLGREGLQPRKLNYALLGCKSMSVVIARGHVLDTFSQEDNPAACTVAVTPCAEPPLLRVFNLFKFQMSF